MYALPTRYRKKYDEHPFPHWIYINKIESSQIIFFRDLVTGSYTERLKKTRMIELVHERDNFKEHLEKFDESFEMTENPKCNEIMQNDADVVPKTLNKQEVLPTGVYLFDRSEEDSVKLFANGARVNEARANYFDKLHSIYGFL